MARHVGLTLSLYMDRDGLGAWPSQETLAQRTGLSSRSVRDALARLVEARWLSREPRKSPRGIRNPRWGYEYVATLPKKLGNAYVNGERRSLFNGQDPAKVRPGMNTEIYAKRIRNHVPTNSLKGTRNYARKRETELRPQEIEDLDHLKAGGVE